MGRKAPVEEEGEEEDLNRDVTWLHLKYGSSKDMTSSDVVTEKKHNGNTEATIKLISAIMKGCSNPCGCHGKLAVLLKSHAQLKSPEKKSSTANNNQIDLLRKSTPRLNFLRSRTVLGKKMGKQFNELKGPTGSSPKKENTLLREVSADSGFSNDSRKQSRENLKMGRNVASTSDSPTIRYSPRIAEALTKTPRRDSLMNPSLMTPETRKKQVVDENAENSSAESCSSERMSALHVSFGSDINESDFLDSVGLTRTPKHTVNHLGITRRTMSPNYKHSNHLTRKQDKSTTVQLDSPKDAKTQQMTKKKANLSKSSVEVGSTRKSMRVVRPPVNIINIQYQEVINKMLLERRQQEEERKQKRNQARTISQSLKLSPTPAKKRARPTNLRQSVHTPRNVQYQEVQAKMLLECRQQEEKRKPESNHKKETRKSSKLSPALAKERSRPRKSSWKIKIVASNQQDNTKASSMNMSMPEVRKLARGSCFKTPTAKLNLSVASNEQDNTKASSMNMSKQEVRKLARGSWFKTPTANLNLSGFKKSRTSPRLAKNNSPILNNSYPLSGAPKRKKRKLYSPENMEEQICLQLMESNAKD